MSGFRLRGAGHFLHPKADLGGPCYCFCFFHIISASHRISEKGKEEKKLPLYGGRGKTARAAELRSSEVARAVVAGSMAGPKRAQRASEACHTSGAGVPRQADKGSPGSDCAMTASPVRVLPVRAPWARGARNTPAEFALHPRRRVSGNGSRTEPLNQRFDGSGCRVFVAATSPFYSFPAKPRTSKRGTG